MGGGGPGERKVSTVESRFDSSLCLTFLKWLCNSEQERIIDRNRYLFFGTLTVLNFPIIQWEHSLRDERTETELWLR